MLRTVPGSTPYQQPCSSGSHSIAPVLRYVTGTHFEFDLKLGFHFVCWLYLFVSP
jgi:hypothetical protein